MIPTGLYDAAAELLAVASAAAPTIGRTFVAPGRPPWDCCPQLTVHAEAIAISPSAQDEGALGALSQRQPRIIVVRLEITVIRCTPEPVGKTMPLPADLAAAALALLTDAWTIYNNVRAAGRAGTLFTGACRYMRTDQASERAEQGGCAGWVIPVLVSLPGYAA